MSRKASQNAQHIKPWGEWSPLQEQKAEAAVGTGSPKLENCVSENI